MGLKHIVHYLKGTKENIIILNPDSKILRLDFFVDADFLGLFASEDKNDPVSIKIRTVILLSFVGIPTY